MKPLLYTVLLCGTVVVLAACAPRWPRTTAAPDNTPLPVAIESVDVRTEGAFALVSLTYHNATATPLSVGLQQWANARTRLVDDARNSYTLLQTSGIGYGDDRRYWLALDPEGRAKASFLFRAEAPTDIRPTRYTFSSGQRLVGAEPDAVVSFTLSLPGLTPAVAH